MKKKIILFVMVITLVLGTGIFLKYLYSYKILSVFNEGKIYYFLQEGVYSNENIMKENIKNLDSKLIIKEDNKYYVYIGITRDIKNARKLKQIYTNKGYQIYLKEIRLNNEEFYNNVYQFDLLIKNANNDKEILTIEEVVLANYEEIVCENKN